MKIFLSIGVASCLSLITFSPLSAQTKSSVPRLLTTQQPTLSSEEEGVVETEKMTEESAGYYLLMSSGRRAFNREEALRLYRLAKSRVPNMEDISESKKQELLQAAEDGIKSVDQINFAQNRENLANHFESTALQFRNRGREDDAKKLQEGADRVRNGQANSIYDAMP